MAQVYSVTWEGHAYNVEALDESEAKQLAAVASGCMPDARRVVVALLPEWLPKAFEGAKAASLEADLSSEGSEASDEQGSEPVATKPARKRRKKKEPADE